MARDKITQGILLSKSNSPPAAMFLAVMQHVAAFTMASASPERLLRQRPPAYFVATPYGYAKTIRGCWPSSAKRWCRSARSGGAYRYRLRDSPNVSVYSDWHVQERGDAMFSQHRGYPHVRLCVQRRLACSAGERPAGARVRSPVVWIAGWRETRNSEAYRQRLPREDDESPGRNDSERESGLESA